jgi:c(7)-type cytochrome triheme protein
MKRAFMILMLLGAALLTGLATAEEFGLKKKRPKPHEYGRVVIDNFSSQKNQAPVVFPHWLHRARFTCRLCHVDIGFAMQGGGTMIREEDNGMGLYCGACHNGRTAFGPREQTLTGKTVNNCERCHSHGREVAFQHQFYEFQKKMPRERFGNGIDWLKAEEDKKIELKDYLEGVTIKRPKIQEPVEFDLKPSEKNMPEIIFSHTKHAKWNGCELCHPEIFPVKRGDQPYTMQEIFAGRYCGLCHDAVAFPNLDCQRCHTKLVY